jgi:ribose transport system substrate-binding protein
MVLAQARQYGKREAAVLRRVVQVGSERPKSRVGWSVVGALAIGGLLLAACGSGTSGTSSPSTSPTGSSGQSAGVAAARAFVAAHTPYPSQILQTQPLASRPPTGKTIDYINSPTTSSHVILQGLDAAAAVLGWKVVSLSTNGDPTTEASAMSLAVENHPSAVVGAGFPAATFATQLGQLRADHIPYVTVGTTDCESTCDYASNGVLVDIGTPLDYTQRGQWLAEWVVANSGGKANSVVWDLSTYQTLTAVAQGYDSELAKLCPSCKLATQDVVATSIGTSLPAQIVTYLQRHPQVDYLVMTYGDLTTGLEAALQSAGLSSQVTIVDQTGGAANLEAIKSGSPEKVFVGESDVIIGWEAADALARYFETGSVSEASYVYLPRNYLTASNISDPQADYVAVPGYKQEFMKLWKVSS